MSAQNQEELKIRNRNRVIRLIITSAPVSRIEISRQTGLTKMTVTNIINELLAEELVQEVGSVGSGPGRRAIRLNISDHAGLVLGLYISRRILHGILCTLRGKIIVHQSCALKAENNETLTEKLLHMADALAVQAPKLLAIGISCLGPLDPNSGMLFTPPRFGTVSDLPLRDLLQQHFSAPVFFDNDMNAAALAEKFFGGAKEEKNFIYLGVSDGIGAGAYLDGSLYRGPHGQSGEIGHVSIDRSGPVCSCGNQGCLELYASIPADFQSRSEERQKALIEEISPFLASGVITLINLFDPDKIFIGHEISHRGDFAAKCLEKEIADKYLGAEKKTVSIHPSMLGINAPVVGSAALCVEQLFPV